jgi:hypothetical protein
MSAVCPKCGVAVVPGYVKCPKCQAPLPAARTQSKVSPGGTAISSGGLPILPLLVGGGVAVAIVLLFALRKDKASASTTEPVLDAPAAEDQPGAQPTGDPTALPTEPTQPTGSAAPDPTEAASALDQALKKQRLWGTVEVVGTRVDIRSGGCRDPQMAPLLDTSSPPLHAAGVTKLRCLEQSGALVFERDL